MKKIISLFALVGLFALAAPKVTMAITQDECKTYIMACDGVIQGYIVACDQKDIDTWAELLCGA